MTGKTRTHTGFRLPPDIERKVNALISSKEFDTKSEVFIAALRFYFDNRELDVEEKIEEFLSSDKGKRLLEELMKNIQNSD